jgi:hypothetical protein
MTHIDKPRDARGLTDSPKLNENDPAAVRDAVKVAADVAADLRRSKSRLHESGLLSQGWGPKMSHRLDVMTTRLDQVNVYLSRRLARLEGEGHTA